MATKIQLRRDTSNNWSSNNPILSSGEIGYETDTRKIKVGNGSSAWNSLQYIASDAPAIGEIAMDAIYAALSMGSGLEKSYNDPADSISLSIDTNVVQTVVRDTHANFVADTTTIYDEGVLLFETDTQRFKFGNGINIFTDIYFAALNTQGGSMQGPIDMQNNKIINLDSPDNINDAVNKNYVDQAILDTRSYAENYTNSVSVTTLSDAETYTNNQVSGHNATTTNVHGIANTSELATQSYAETYADNVGSATYLNAMTYTDDQINFATNNIEMYADSAANSALDSAQLYTDNRVSIEVAATLQTAESYTDLIVSDHSITTEDVHGIANTADLATHSYADTVAANEVSTHNSATTNVHGIANTANLATQSYADNSSLQAQTNAEDYTDTVVSNHNSTTTNIHGIADTSELATKTYTNNAVSTHNSTTTNVHGIANTAYLATQTYADDVASIAESNANDYTDTAISTEVTNRNSAISSAVSSAISTEVTNRNNAISSAISTEVSNRDSAIATAKSQAISTSETYTDNQIENLVNAAPSTLDTLKELADALGSDPNFATTITNNIATAKSQAISTAESYTDTQINALTTSDIEEGTNLYYTDERAQDAIGLNLGNGLSYDDTTGAISNSGVRSFNTRTGAVTLSGSDVNTALGYTAANALDVSSLGTQTASDIADAIVTAETYTDTVVGALTTSNIPEGSRLYYTDERAQDAINDLLIAGTGVSKNYDDNANHLTLSIGQSVATSANVTFNSVTANLTGDVTGTVSSLSNHTTSDLSEGLNLYYTQERVQDEIYNTIVGGTGIDATYVDNGSNPGTLTLDIDSTVVTLDGTQTLTNKTLTSPVINSPTGITKSDVGLSNVNNTSDANKPISTATQSALDLKAPLASPTFTGTVTLPTGTVTSGMILDGTIVNADINASAAIALSKLATDPLARANHTGTQTASTISDFDTQVITSKVTDLTAPTSSFSMNSQKITNVATPTSDNDAANKAYVDAAITNVNIHESVVAATTGNVNLNNAVDNNKVLDGVTIKTGDRILVKNQNTASQNGIYIVASNGAPTRATDYDAAGEVSAGDFIFVENGTVNANTGWVQTYHVVTVGTDPISFTQFSGAGTYTAGNGLTLTGTTFSINTGTTVDLSTAQTLTNKTLTSPTITGTGAIAGTFTGNLTGNVTGNITGNAGTVTNGIYTTDTGTVTSTMIADGTIVNADINATAAIAATKISGTAVTQADTGTVTSAMILDGTIVNADINATAAIDKTKISGTAVTQADTGTVTNTMLAGSISNAKLSNSSITVNGTSFSLGDSKTIKASTTNALTISTGLSGTSFDGGSAVIIAIDSTVATLTGIQTLTNKTLTSPVISTITNTGTLTLPTSTDTLVGKATTDTLTNKTVNLLNNILTGTTAQFNAALSDNDFATLDGSETLTNKTLTSPVIATIVNTGTLTLPTATTTLVGRTTTDTLTNKTLTLPTIGSTGANFNGSTSGTITLVATGTAGTNTITLPAATGTVVTTGDTGSVTSTMIADGTIVNADISSSAAIAVSKLAASTISGVSLGSNLGTLTIGTGLSGTSYNGSGAVTIAIDSTVATLTGSQTLTNKTLSSAVATGGITHNGSTSGTILLQATAVAGTNTITLPATTGTVVTTGDTGSVTNTMLAGSIANAKLTNSSVTIGSTSVSLGSTASTVAGLTLTSPSMTSPTVSSGTLTVSSSGIVFTDGTQTLAGTPSLTPINAQTASITLSASFAKDSFVQMNVASANTVTIPPDSTYSYGIGASIDFQQLGAGQTSFVAGAGVTFQAASVNGSAALKFRGQYSVATALKVAANTWAIFGDLTN